MLKLTGGTISTYGHGSLVHVKRMHELRSLLTHITTYLQYI
jgi:hypothetical protein